MVESVRLPGPKKKNLEPDIIQVATKEKFEEGSREKDLAGLQPAFRRHSGLKETFEPVERHSSLKEKFATEIN